MEILELVLYSVVSLFVLVFTIAWGFTLYVDNLDKDNRDIPVYGVVSVVCFGGYVWYKMIGWGIYIVETNAVFG